MTASELAERLRDMYCNAPVDEAVCMIHLFAIKFANEIKECDASVKEIAKTAGINESYITEISKGIKLAKYVQLKPSLD